MKGNDFAIAADLVLLAMGFEIDSRGNVVADTQRFETSEPGIFAAGDVRRGQSLVAWAQWEGRGTTRVVDHYLMGGSRLQSRAVFI